MDVVPVGGVGRRVQPRTPVERAWAERAWAERACRAHRHVTAEEADEHGGERRTDPRAQRARRAPCRSPGRPTEQHARHDDGQDPSVPAHDGGVSQGEPPAQEGGGHDERAAEKHHEHERDEPTHPAIVGVPGGRRQRAFAAALSPAARVSVIVAVAVAVAVAGARLARVTVVVDASLIVALLVADERQAAAQAQLGRGVEPGEPLHAPAVLAYEVANVVARLVFEGHLAVDAITDTWSDLAALDIVIHPFDLVRDGPAVAAITAQLRRRHSTDAAYVHSAQRLGTYVWTLDRPLARNAVDVGLPVTLVA